MNSVLKTALIISAAVLLLGGITVGILKWLKSRNIVDGPGMVREEHYDFSGTYLTEISYYRGGGSLGDSNSLEMTVRKLTEDRGEVQVVYSDRPTHDSKETNKTVRLSVSVLTGVDEIIERYHMTEWKDLPKTDLFALDAPSMSLTCEFSDGTSIRLGSDLDMPDQAYPAITELLNYIKTCAGIRKE